MSYFDYRTLSYNPMKQDYLFEEREIETYPCVYCGDECKIQSQGCLSCIRSEYLLAIDK